MINPQSLPNGLLNPTDKEVGLHIRMMTELCRLRGTPSVIDNGDGVEKVRMLLIEDNPTGRLLKYYGFNNRSEEADEIIAHVALEEDDILINHPPLNIKSGWLENKSYRVDGIKIHFDKRFFMTLVLVPWSAPVNINKLKREDYGSEGRINEVTGKDCDMGVTVESIKSSDNYGNSEIVVGRPMITKK